MNSLITTIFSAFTETIKGLTAGLKEALTNVLYVDASATELVVSDLAIFIFLMFGVGLAMGIVNKVLGMVKR